MKYLMILTLSSFSLPVLGQTSPSPDLENCHYRTEDAHVVSNNSYSRLLTQLTKSYDEEKRKKRRRRTGPVGTGQR